MNIKVSSVSVLFACLTGVAGAQSTAASSYFNVAEAKAECQRLVKLHVQRQLVKADDRLEKNLRRAVADLERIAGLSGEWAIFIKRPELATRLAGDIKALNAAAMVPAASPAALSNAIALADRCTADADEALKEIQGTGAGGRAVSLSARALYLSQRTVRDWMLLHSDVKFKGITQELLEKERDELGATLQQLAALPSTSAIKASLDQAQNQWTLLRPLLAGNRSTPDKDDQAGRISERLYEALDESFEQIQKAVIALM